METQPRQLIFSHVNQTKTEDSSYTEDKWQRLTRKCMSSTAVSYFNLKNTEIFASWRLRTDDWRTFAIKKISPPCPYKESNVQKCHLQYSNRCKTCEHTYIKCPLNTVTLFFLFQSSSYFIIKKQAWEVASFLPEKLRHFSPRIPLEIYPPKSGTIQRMPVTRPPMVRWYFSHNHHSESSSEDSRRFPMTFVRRKIHAFARFGIEKTSWALAYDQILPFDETAWPRITSQDLSRPFVRIIAQVGLITLKIFRTRERTRSTQAVTFQNSALFTLRRAAKLA